MALVTRDDARALLARTDLVEIGMLAEEARRARHGSRITFVRVLEVDLGSPLPGAAPHGAGEVRLSPLPPSTEEASRAVASAAALVRRVAPDAPLTGFSLHEIAALARRERTSIAGLSAALKGAGLEAVSEAPLDRLDDPAGTAREAREGGLGIARLTVHSYGDAGPLDLFDRARAVAAALGGAPLAFAPLPRSVGPSSPTTGYDDVRLVAVARLYLETIDHIQVDWAVYGPKLAQVALIFGADDLDRVPPDVPSANLLGPRRAPLEEVRRNIRAAALDPVERNARFEPLASPTAT